ncbi:hypothetical protein [Arthrobacter sp. UYEF20]|uniref:hypothetical protein n=1 Tax=Arthrobacter sp. UYEF20 TaxID=1756363 RepID=UPI00339866F3
MTTADLLRDLLLGIDGVLAVYPADPAWRLAARQARTRLTGGDPPADTPPVEVRTEDGNTTVRVRLGVALDTPAPDIARKAARTLRTALQTGHPHTATRITVQICSITHDRPAHTRTRARPGARPMNPPPRR